MKTVETKKNFLTPEMSFTGSVGFTAHTPQQRLYTNDKKKRMLAKRTGAEKDCLQLHVT